MRSSRSVRDRRITSLHVLAAIILFAALAAGVGMVMPRAVASQGPASDSSVYIVQPGDTLADIAAQHGVTIAGLVATNDLPNPDFVAVGSHLTLPPASGALASYEVRPGDTLWGIAAASGIGVARLADLNGIVEDATLTTGTKLRVPAASTIVSAQNSDRKHVVRSGETLSSIASDYGVSVASLVAANPAPSPNLIRIGQTIVIPVFSLPRLSAQIEAALRRASAEFKLDPYLVLALSLMESGWQSNVVSHTGAVGLMQLMPDTANWTVLNLVPAATNWRVSTEDNARVGAAYLHYLLVLEGADVAGALASYYEGWFNYKLYGMFDDTRKYVDGILALREGLRAGGLG